MADRKFSYQKENFGGDPAEIARVQAEIDARNPTKPGQYTGKPVPLDQKERRPPTVNANRIEAIKDKLTSSDPEDLNVRNHGALNNTVEAIPMLESIIPLYIMQRLLLNNMINIPNCLHRFIQVGIQGINFHWQSSRNYTWEELTGQVYMVKSIELDDLLAIPYAKFITK